LHSLGLTFELLNYAEHSLGSGDEARAVAYIQVAHDDQSTFYGAAVSGSVQ
jgi:hypothetical protein